MTLVTSHTFTVAESTPSSWRFASSIGSNEYPQLLQIGGEPHFAAVLGILALVLLGGILVIRNRLDRTELTDTERDQHHEEFLTDREKVCTLIRENGGRMKQSAIVDSVDWSKAKVSRLLAELEEDGEITKLRLGRENLVCIRGDEPAASQSSDPSGDLS